MPFVTFCDGVRGLRHIMDEGHGISRAAFTNKIPKRSVP